MSQAEAIRALAKRWGQRAEMLVTEPVRSKEERAYVDAKVTTLRYCEKQLVDELEALSVGESPDVWTDDFKRRCLSAIDAAIFDEDGLDGRVGEMLLKEAGKWPALPDGEMK